jgi:hypothetical protein
MLMDKQNLFADAQTLIHAVGTWNSDNVIDLWGAASMPAGPLGTPLYDVGRGCCKKLLVQIVETSLAAGGASTVQIALINAEAADLTGNPVILAKTEAISKADLVAGYRFAELNIIPAKCTKRYLGLQISIATFAGTQGKLTAAIVHDADTGPGSFV